MLVDTIKTELSVRELANGLRTLLRQTNLFQDALDSRKARALRMEGRRSIAQALGLSSLAVDRESTVASRPISPSKCSRCIALDVRVLSEVCDALCLNTAPWPLVRTQSSRAERVLSIVGALGSVTLMSQLASSDTIAAQVLAGIIDLLAATAQQRQLATKQSQKVCGYRDRGGTIRSDRPMQRLAEWMHLKPGDEVLARWALRDGEPSQSVEEARVLAVDAASGRMRLRYVDGMELLVPYDWIFERRQPKRTEIDQQAFKGALQSDDYSFDKPTVEHADYTLKMLLRGTSSPAEICNRIRTLCDRPQGLGVQSLTEAVCAALPRISELGRHNTLEALCTFCNAGAQDAACARAFANAILLSDCCSLRCSQSQLAALRYATALSATQKSKLLALTTPTSSWSRA